MDWIPVASSNLSAVAYDRSRQLLVIRFHSGSVYEYYDVPPSVFDGLLAASSKGSFHYAYIRDRYRYRQVS